VKPKVRRRRPKTRWSVKDTAIIKNYFGGWISQKEGFPALPGKSDITTFLQTYPDIKFEWTVVRNKVLSEKTAYAKRRQSRIHAMSF